MDLKSLAEKIKYNTELNHYFGLFSYREVVTLIDNGAETTGGYQYSQKDFQHEIDAGRDKQTYFYFKLNPSDLNKFGQKNDNTE